MAPNLHISAIRQPWHVCFLNSFPLVLSILHSLFHTLSSVVSVPAGKTKCTTHENPSQLWCSHSNMTDLGRYLRYLAHSNHNTMVCAPNGTLFLTSLLLTYGHWSKVMHYIGDRVQIWDAEKLSYRTLRFGTTETEGVNIFDICEWTPKQCPTLPPLSEGWTLPWKQAKLIIW